MSRPTVPGKKFVVKSVIFQEFKSNRRMVEQELADTNETLSDQTCTNQAIQGAKLKCEHEMSKMSHDLDEMTAEAAMSEEKARV